MNDHRLAPLALSALIAGLTTALFSLSPARASDTWWHLALGRVIDRFDAVPDKNHFAFAIPKDAPSLIHDWLGDLLLYRAFDAFSIEGVVTLRNLCFFTSILLLSLTLKTRSPLTRLLVGSSGALLTALATFATPAMLAAPLFSLCALTSARWRWHADRRLAALSMLLPILCCALWANLDIAYGLLSLLAAYNLGATLFAMKSNAKNQTIPEDHREIPNSFHLSGWGVATLGTLLAPLANPRGPALFPHTLEVLLRYPGHPDAPLWSPLWTSSNLPEFALTLLAIIALLALYRRVGMRRVLPELALLTALTFLALTHLRALMWLGLATPLLIAPVRTVIEDRLAPRDPAWLSRRLTLVVALLLGACGATLTSPLFLWRANLVAPLAAPLHLRATPPHQHLVPDELPIEATRLLAQHLRAPRVYASPRYEGYIQLQLQERQIAQVTCTDPRHELFSDEIIRLRQLLRDDPDLWRGVFQGLQIEAALLSTEEDAPLIERLTAHPDWMLVHSHPTHAYFVRVIATPP